MFSIKNSAAFYPVSLHCWEVPKLETLPTYSLSYYIAELFPTLNLSWRIPCLVTLLRYSQSWNTVVVYPVLSYGWGIPILGTFLICTLSHYNAEMFPNLRHCWKYSCILDCILSLHTISSPSYNIAEAYLVLLHCWAIAISKILLMYILPPCSAKMLPILKHCRRISRLVTLLSYSQP